MDFIEQLAVEERVDTVMAYCTWTLQDRRLGVVAKRLKQAGIGVLNASPLGMGLLTHIGAPNWHPAHETVQNACRELAKFCEEHDENLSRIAIQFAISTALGNGIASTVIGTSSEENMLENIAWSKTPLDPQIYTEIEKRIAPVLNIGWDILQGSGGKAKK